MFINRFQINVDRRYLTASKNKQPHAILVVYDGIKSDTASALANGMRLSNIRIDYYAKERSNTSAHLNVWVQDKKSRSLVEQGIALAEIQEGIGHLVNMPSNEKNPSVYSGLGA